MKPVFFWGGNCFYSYIYISTLLFYYIYMMMINLHQIPQNMSSIGAVCDSLGMTFLSLLDNLGATGGLWLNSSPVKVKLIIFPLFLPKGNAILPITPNAGCGTRPEYQLSADIHSHKAGTKLPYKLALYLLCPRFFCLLNYFWLCTVVVRHCQPLSKCLQP